MRDDYWGEMSQPVCSIEGCENRAVVVEAGKLYCGPHSKRAPEENRPEKDKR